ncbi:divalent-cation tolerance protein CutA [Nesterenkonia alba]|uniref:divalent-cation tolerance protein CutA n=1 Tax=Nesterenkonia alba TaxID=515814 RepID=UPI00042897D1|nr:divalent-cation tolerance protein CutA [Nesterenkonia alba]
MSDQTNQIPQQSNQPAQYVAVQTTVETHDDAERLASTLVEKRLAACVQISEIRSVYHWVGAVQQDTELLLTCKTSFSAVPQLRELIAAEHPYDEPELIVLPIIGGSQTYLEWVGENSRGL